MTITQIFSSLALIGLFAIGIYYLIEAMEEYIASDEMED
jgi:hypothetical protein